MTGRSGVIQNRERLVAARRLFEEFAVPAETIAAFFGVKRETVDRHARTERWRCAPTRSDMVQIRSRLLRVVRDNVAPLLDDPAADPSDIAKLAQSMTRLMEAALRLFGTVNEREDEAGVVEGAARDSLFRKLDAFVADDAAGVA